MSTKRTTVPTFENLEGFFKDYDKTREKILCDMDKQVKSFQELQARVVEKLARGIRRSKNGAL